MRPYSSETVRAGLTPYQALASGTRNPAEYHGASDEFGTVEKGKRADLLLVEGHPLLRGRWLPRAELQRRMDGVADEIRRYEEYLTQQRRPPIRRTSP
ncbi:MAG: amidohydrolase family protein [Gemmatimonadales bacterium]|nr:amidohydrolase family protein [Gemmatimonadales bacterium]